MKATVAGEGSSHEVVWISYSVKPMAPKMQGNLGVDSGEIIFLIHGLKQRVTI